MGFKYIELTGGSLDPNTWGLPCTPRADMIFNIQSMRDLHPNERDPSNPVQVPICVVWCYEGMFKVQETLPVIQQKIAEALKDNSDTVFIQQQSSHKQQQEFLKSAATPADKSAQNRFIAAAREIPKPAAISYQPGIQADAPVKKGLFAGLRRTSAKEDSYD